MKINLNLNSIRYIIPCSWCCLNVSKTLSVINQSSEEPFLYYGITYYSNKLSHYVVPITSHSRF